jgi:hypothetical protein
MKLESKLTDVISHVYNAPTVFHAKSILIPFLQESKIKDTDKKKMIAQAEKISDLTRLQTYATNALLKFEGLGII